MDETETLAPVVRRGELPLGSVLMELRDFRRDSAPPDASKAAAARASIVFTTGARVLRYDWYAGRQYLEELVVSDDAVNLERLQRGAPLLDTHSGWSLRDTLGVVENPKIEGGRGTVDATFSRRPEVAGVVQDVEDGILRNVSVGYSRDKVEKVPPQREGDPWVYRVTRWTPHEVSIVPMPADIDAQIQRSASGAPVIRDENGERPVRTFPCEMSEVPVPTIPTAAARGTNEGEAKMDEEQKKAAAEAEAKAQAETAAREAGAKAERARIADIKRRCAIAKLDSAFETRMIEEGVHGDAIAARILDAMATREEATPTRSESSISITRDEVDTRRAAMSEAIEARVNPAAKVSEAARQFRGLRLIDLAREAVIACGGSVRGLSVREIAVAALNCDRDVQTRAGMMGTSDFPLVLASTVGRKLRQAYDLAPRTFQPWTRQSTAPDFRQVARLQLSELGALQQVNESGEYKYVTFGETQEKYSLVKYGAIVAITWESLINDDMGAFDRVPMMIGNSAAANESDIVYGVLTANAAMADSVALFHATHANLGTAAAINIASLQLGRAAIRKQTDPSGKKQLNLVPRFLICGPDKELEAYQYTSPNYVPATNATINPSYNTNTQVVIEGRLTGNQWYLSADPAQIDTIEYAYLEGEEALFTERREGFEVDGVEIKVRQVFAAKAIDHRGLYKNPGA